MRGQVNAWLRWLGRECGPRSGGRTTALVRRCLFVRCYGVLLVRPPAVGGSLRRMLHGFSKSGVGFPWLRTRSLPCSRPFVDPKRDRHAIFEPTYLRHPALTGRCRGLKEPFEQAAERGRVARGSPAASPYSRRPPAGWARRSGRRTGVASTGPSPRPYDTALGGPPADGHWAIGSSGYLRVWITPRTWREPGPFLVPTTRRKRILVA